MTKAQRIGEQYVNEESGYSTIATDLEKYFKKRGELIFQLMLRCIYGEEDHPHLDCGGYHDVFLGTNQYGQGVLLRGEGEFRFRVFVDGKIVHQPDVALPQHERIRNSFLHIDIAIASIKRPSEALRFLREQL